MEYLNRRLHWLDRLQRTKPIFGFPIAVIKKYSDDRGGYQAALLTYYGFLSLFPAVLITITVAGWLLQADSHLRQRIVSSVTNYFPLIGQDLQQNLHGFSKTGLPLLVGIFILIYGLRGAADVFRHTVNNIWRVPEEDRSGFWSALARSMAIVGVAGVGFFGSAVITGYAGAARHDIWLRVILLLAGSAMIFVAFLMATKLALNRVIRRRYLWVGAAITTIGLLLLQNLGRYMLSHELKNLNTLYGTFAAVLGLFFWIYLQSQIIVYAMEISSVRALKLWPRSIMGRKKEA
jgi:YihY family inner membrane protein